MKNTGSGSQTSTSTAPESTEGESDMSSKWSLKQLKQEYEKMGISYNEVFKNIK